MSEFMIDNACCKEEPGDQSESRDCLERWKEQKSEVSNKYRRAAAETSKSREEYTRSLSWQAKLMNWDEIIKKADEKANEVVNQLEFFLEQVLTVCENAKSTVQVLEKLICLVKSIFDALHTYNQNEGGLIDRIEDLKTAVECLQHIDEADKAEVMKCIAAYEEKITEVYQMQDDILSKLLETLKSVSLLHAYVCEDGGLRDKLEGIYEDFKGKLDEDDEDCDDEGDDEGDDGEDDGGNEIKQSADASYPCDHKKAILKPQFPISEMAYYKEIVTTLEDAIKKTRELEEEWVENKKKSDGFLSNKNSLEEAIKAAEAAERAK